MAHYFECANNTCRVTVDHANSTEPSD